MAKASIRLSNGTNVTIEGTTEEIQRLLIYYGGARSAEEAREEKKSERQSTPRQETASEPDIAKVVNTIKSCDESEAIEKNILDRISVVDRTLLPLFIVHKYMKNEFGLTSGDINRVTTELGIPIATPNIANNLAGSASRYVVGDKLRKQGTAVRYKISHRGVKYLQAVISGDKHGK